MSLTTFLKKASAQCVTTPTCPGLERARAILCGQVDGKAFADCAVFDEGRNVRKGSWSSAGAAWFRRVSAALQQDPGVTYRRWIAALLPDLLKGTFNHDARTEVCH